MADGEWMTGFLSVRGKVASWHGRVLWSGGTKTCGRCFDKLSMTDGRARRQSAVATVRWQTGCAGENCDREYDVVASPHDRGLPNEPNFVQAGVEICSGQSQKRSQFGDLGGGGGRRNIKFAKRSQLFSAFEYLDNLDGQVVGCTSGAVFQLASFVKNWLRLGVFAPRFHLREGSLGALDCQLTIHLP